MSTVKERFKNHLKHKYEYLSVTAIEKLFSCFSYDWK